MEGQGKRLLLAVALALGVMLVWNMVFSTKKDDAKKPVPAAGSAAGTTPGSSAARMATSLVCKAAAATAPAKASAAEAPSEALLTLTFPKFTATFTSDGGALKSWQLTDPRFGKDATKGQLMAGLPRRGALYVNFKQGSTYCIPEAAEWKGTKVSDTVVTYVFSNEQLEVEKTFTLDPEVFLVHMVVKVTAKVPAGKEAKQTLVYTAYAFQDPDHIDKGSSRSLPRAWTSSTLVESTIKETPIADVLESPRGEVGIRWSGFEHPYLLAALRAALRGPGDRREADVPAHARAQGTDADRHPDDVAADVQGGRWSGDARARRVSRPEELSRRSRPPTPPPGSRRASRTTIDLGWFAFIGRPLLWLLLKFHAFFGNWGIAIILLTFLVKAATLYWTTKSMRSMKAMAALAPQMKELQEKYKADRQRLQVETMALYKQHDVNPIAGLSADPAADADLARAVPDAVERRRAVPAAVHPGLDRRPDRAGPVLHPADRPRRDDVPAGAADAADRHVEVQQKMHAVRHAADVRRDVVLLPGGPDALHLHEHLLTALHSIYMNKFDKKSLEIAAQLKANAGRPCETAEVRGGEAGQRQQEERRRRAKVAKPVIDVDSVESTETMTTRRHDSSASRTRPRKRKKRAEIGYGGS